jgi:hypothetical protein
MQKPDLECVVLPASAMRCIIDLDPCCREAALPGGFFSPAFPVLDGLAGVSVIYWRNAS